MTFNTRIRLDVVEIFAYTCVAELNIIYVETWKFNILHNYVHTILCKLFILCKYMYYCVTHCVNLSAVYCPQPQHVNVTRFPYCHKVPILSQGSHIVTRFPYCHKVPI